MFPTQPSPWAAKGAPMQNQYSSLPSFAMPQAPQLPWAQPQPEGMSPPPPGVPYQPQRLPWQPGLDSNTVRPGGMDPRVLEMLKARMQTQRQMGTVDPNTMRRGPQAYDPRMAAALAMRLGQQRLGADRGLGLMGLLDRRR